MLTTAQGSCLSSPSAAVTSYCTFPTSSNSAASIMRLPPQPPCRRRRQQPQQPQELQQRCTRGGKVQ